MGLEQIIGRIGLGFIPTYGTLWSREMKLSLRGKPVLIGIREGGEK